METEPTPPVDNTVSDILPKPAIKTKRRQLAMDANWDTGDPSANRKQLPELTTEGKPIDSDDDDDSSSSKRSSSQQFPFTNERIVLNVGGQVHETYIATLNRLPDTRLAKLAHELDLDPSFDPESGQYFFNRNPIIFTSILQYYRTGELHIDHNICGNAIKNELDFWHIDANDIEPCCWAQYAKFLENKETLKMLDDSFAIYEDVFAEPEGEGGWKRLQRRLWRHIEDPSYSPVGQVIAWLSIIFVVLSIVAYVLETHPFFRVPHHHSHLNSTLNFTNATSGNQTNVDEDEETDIFDLVESNSDVVWWLSFLTFACFAWFLLEYLLRLTVCPNKKQFFASMLNNLDLLVLLAMCVESLAIILVEAIPRSSYLKVLIPLRFARIIRIMKLMKHYRAFKVLVYTIKVSAKELLLMIIFLMIGVVMFACLAYYIEPETFENIPIACWWALVTMTTVGFGDYYPKRIGGYIIGSVAAIFGVLMIAFTVPIVVNNFSLYYSHAQTRAKMKPKRRATKLLNKLAALTMFVPTLDEIQEAAEAELEAKNNLAKGNQKKTKRSKSLERLKLDDGTSGEHRRDSVASLLSTDSGMVDKRKTESSGQTRSRKGSFIGNLMKSSNSTADSGVKTEGSGSTRPKSKVNLADLDEVNVLPSVDLSH